MHCCCLSCTTSVSTEHHCYWITVHHLAIEKILRPGVGVAKTSFDDLGRRDTIREEDIQHVHGP